MHLKTLSLGDIHPYERNPRINDRAVEPVMKSIEKDGYRARIIVDKDGVIIAGHQRMTQQSAGGLTDAYLDAGTYVKSFYSVMYSPSCVKLGVLGDGASGERHERINHRVLWGKCTPKIISSKYRKWE